MDPKVSDEIWKLFNDTQKKLDESSSNNNDIDFTSNNVKTVTKDVESISNNVKITSDNVKTVTKDVEFASSDVKSASDNIKSVPASIKKVIVPNTSKFVSKTSINDTTSKFTKDVMKNLNKFAKKAITPGSIFTHDIYVVETLKDMFKNIDKGNNVDSVVENDSNNTNRSIRDELFKGYINELSIGLKNWTSGLLSNLEGKLKTILGPLAEYYELAKSFFKNTIGKIWSLFIKKKGDKKMSKLADAGLNPGSIYTHDIHLEEQLQEQSELLKSVVNFFKKAEKKDARTLDKKKSPWMKILISAVALVAGLLTGYVTKMKDALVSLTIAFDQARFRFDKIFNLKELNIGKLFDFKNMKWVQKLQKLFSSEGKLAFVGKIFTKIGNLFTKIVGFLKGPLTKVVDFLKSVFTKVSNLFKGPLGKISKTIGFVFEKIKNSKFFRIGKILGKIFLPLEMAYKGIKGLFSEGSIRDKLLNMSAGLLDPILMIPEMIGNGILWLARKIFGETFLEGMEFDFSAQGIKDKVNDITDWIFNNVTVPVMDFFSITLPDLIKKPFVLLWDKILVVKKFFLGDKKEEKLGIIDIILDFFKGISETVYNWLVDNVPGAKWALEGIQSLIDSFGTFIDPIFDNITSFFTNISSSIYNWILDNVPGVQWIVEGASSLIDSFGSTIENKKNVFEKLVNWIKEIPGKITDWIMENVPGAKLAVKGVDIAKGLASKGISWIKGLWSDEDKGGKSSDMVGKSSPKSKQAMNWFMSKEGGGFTKEQAAGIVGNLQAESNLNPKAFNKAGGGQGAQGIAQWRGSRLKDFEKFSGMKMKDSTYEEQLKFMTYEMTQGKEQKAGRKIKQADTAKQAANATDIWYERSGGHTRQRRQKYAEAVMQSQMKEQGRVDAAQSDIDKAKKEQSQQKQIEKQQEIERQEKTIRVTQQQTDVTKNVGGDVANNMNMMINSGGNEGIPKDIPEEADNYMLGLAVGMGA